MCQVAQTAPRWAVNLCRRSAVFRDHTPEISGKNRHVQSAWPRLVKKDVANLKKAIERVDLAIESGERVDLPIENGEKVDLPIEHGDFL